MLLATYRTQIESHAEFEMGLTIVMKHLGISCEPREECRSPCDKNREEDKMEIIELPTSTRTRQHSRSKPIVLPIRKSLSGEVEFEIPGFRCQGKELPPAVLVGTLDNPHTDSLPVELVNTATDATGKVQLCKQQTIESVNLWEGENMTVELVGKTDCRGICSKAIYPVGTVSAIPVEDVLEEDDCMVVDDVSWTDSAREVADVEPERWADANVTCRAELNIEAVTPKAIVVVHKKSF